MSDPRYTDPRYDQPPLQTPNDRARQLGQMESTNAMWGWIAGGVVIVLMLLFIFGRSPDSSNTTAMDNPLPPRSTTGQAPPAPPATAQVPRPTPSTTGQAPSSSQ